MVNRGKHGVLVGAILGALCALLLTAVAHGADSDERFREEFHQTYPLAATGRVELGNINGDVKITGWDRNEVKLDAVKSADAQEKLAGIEIKVDASAESIRIKTHYPKCEDHGCNNPGSVEYTLMVPRGARLDQIKLVNGNLDLDQINGEVDGASVNGRVEGRNLAGRIDLSTVNGEVSAVLGPERMKSTEPVKLHSVNGRVEATLPSDANAELTAHTVNGSIRTDFELPVERPRYGPGSRLEGRLGNGGVRFDLSTVNGSIRVNRANDGRPRSSATSLLPADRSRMF
jgi:Toastrack DUF4097